MSPLSQTFLRICILIAAYFKSELCINTNCAMNYRKSPTLWRDLFFILGNGLWGYCFGHWLVLFWMLLSQLSLWAVHYSDEKEEG